jgi:hypothetical protein
VKRCPKFIDGCAPFVSGFSPPVKLQYDCRVALAGHAQSTPVRAMGTP